MKFKYETHLHTAPASACAREPGPEYARMYKELGYAGVMVTGAGDIVMKAAGSKAEVAHRILDARV